MLIRTEELKNYSIQITNGADSKISDYYFNDLFWNIQFLVLKGIDLFEDNTIFVSQFALDIPDPDQQNLKINVYDIEKHKNADVIQPVSAVQRERISKLKEWPLKHLNLESLNDEEINKLIIHIFPHEGYRLTHSEPHLRSYNEVLGYNIRAKNGEVGHIDDFILETKNWKIRYLIIDTSNWLPGSKKVVMSPAWIEKIKWAKNLFQIDLRKEVIERSPAFDPNHPLDDAFELKIFKHYGSQITGSNS